MTFYFYDLETSGVSAKHSRIMQFAGQRTNERLEPIGEPDDMYVQLSRDILPEPEAVLITGITPQKTLQDGVTEAEFTDYFDSKIATPDTVFVGFNNIRFDDEFMRYTLYRNFHDAYEWHWKDGRSRWDMLDVVRMTRALRPKGIVWPNDSAGKPSNRLELLTGANNIDHLKAHTALADVNATMAVANLVLKSQPKLFAFMLDMRDKKKVKNLVTASEPFVYVSGRYESRYEKMTIVACCREESDGSGALVFDLRYDPETWAKKSPKELSDSLNNWSEDPEARLPFKILQYNKCPSIAPLSVIDSDSAKRLEIDDKKIRRHFEKLKDSEKLVNAVQKLFEDRKKSFQTSLLPEDRDPDARLYDGFFSDGDRRKCADVRSLTKTSIAAFEPMFEDGRLTALFPLYKARNFPKVLSDTERKSWEIHVEEKLFESGNMEKFLQKLQELSARGSLTSDQKYLLEELKLYAESITPASY